MLIYRRILYYCITRLKYQVLTLVAKEVKKSWRVICSSTVYLLENCRWFLGDNQVIKAANFQVDGQTSAPPLLTEADLISLMEAHGIGTDATHAEHIETIKNRGYVGLTPDSRFIPGQLGMGLVDG